jgi:hypothetical protein
VRIASFAVTVLVCCAHNAPPVERIEILPAIGGDVASASGTLDDASCQPEAFDPIDADGTGALDRAHLRRTLDSARAFCQRCCNGLDAVDANVVVTLLPEGFTTEVTIQPEPLGSTPTGACLYASFHRVTTKAFHGDAVTTSVQVRIHR